MKHFIYIMTNPSMRDNLIKIGYSADPEKRRKELSHQSGVPADYEIYATYEIPIKLGDKQIHKLIQTLNPKLRYNPSKEFFTMDPEDAYKILEVFANVHDRASYLVRYKDGKPIIPIIENKENVSKQEVVESKSELDEAICNQLFFCKGKDANAKGVIKDGNIIVLKGSRITSSTVPSLSKGNLNSRLKLIEDGIIDELVFQRDYEMNPSKASSIILGRPSNGNDDWKTEKGIELGKFRRK